MRSDAASSAPVPARLTLDMTTMIYRVVAGYAVLGRLPGLPQLLSEAPTLARPWLMGVLGSYLVTTAGMLAQAVRARSLRGWAGASAAVTLLAVATLPLGATQPPPSQPWLFWELGLAIVCAGVWGGLRPTIVYALALGLCWGLVRVMTSGGSLSPLAAVSEAVFATLAGLLITVVAVGMLTSAVLADRIADRLYARQLQQAVDRAVSEERARLDQLIHDDVMTTLTAAAYAGDVETGSATAVLARETLDKINGLPSTGGREGSLSLALLGTLARQTVRRVSPDVDYQERLDRTDAVLRVPMEVTETVLGALREAVRNAVRHAGASLIQVGLTGRRRGAELQLEVSVTDDGRGFDRAQVPVDRLGVRVSMLEAPDRVGVVSELRTAPERGTVFSMRWAGAAGQVRERRGSLPPSDDGLPVAFPAGQFVTVMWLAYAVEVVSGLVNLAQPTLLGAELLAMALLGASFACVLLPRAALALPLGAGLACLLTQTLALLVANTTLPLGSWPDLAFWYLFPSQLTLVVLVIRRRLGLALLGLVAAEACLAWWSAHSVFGWEGLLRSGSGHVLFVLIAIVVDRVLRRIARRQRALRAEEDEAIDESVRRHVALVQRSLWVADLKAQARDILARLAEVDGAVPPALRYDALLVEATLRESLVARNMMSDELAELTENARRRGVDVRYVDSRHTVVPIEVSQALLDAIRRALASETVVRLVVRLAPDDDVSKATVLAEDATGTHLLTLDRDGIGAAREVHTREP